MKKCPFCKNEIPSTAAECPICKMVLMEKIPSARSAQQEKYTPPPKAEKEKARAYYSAPPPKNNFQFPKIGNGLLYSVIGSIVLTVILSAIHGHPNPLPPPVPVATATVLDPQSIATTPVPHAPYNSLPNGTVLYSSPSLGGMGVLTISNGSGSDAVVKLITSGGIKVYSVYIRGGDSFSIKNINDGVYRLLFAFGSDWSTGEGKFLVDPSAQSFDDTFDFETTDETSSTQYTTFTVTLNPVLDGKATTSNIDPSTFDQY